MKYHLSPAEGIRTQAEDAEENSPTVLVALAAVMLTSVLTGRVLVLRKITKVPRKRRAGGRRRRRRKV